MYDAAGNPLSIEGRVFEAWIAPAQTKTGVAEPVKEIKVLTFQDGLSLVPPTDGSGDQTVKNTLVHQVSRAFAQANFPRGELTADLLEVVDGARRLFAPVRLFYADPAQIREFVADRAGITFGQGRQPIVTPVAIAGQAGRRGAGFITGTLPPQPSDGEDGDYFVVERTGQANLVYGPKEGGEWPPQPSSTFGVGGVADVPGLSDVLNETAKNGANEDITSLAALTTAAKGDIVTAVVPTDLLGAANLAAAATRALNKPWLLPPASTVTLTVGPGLQVSSLTVAIKAISRWIIPADSSLTLQLPAGKTINPTLVWTHPYGERITIAGQSSVSYTPTGFAGVTGSQNNWQTTIQFGAATAAAVGDYMLCYTTSGTGDHEMLRGVFPVTAVNGAQVTLRNTAWVTAFPALTLTGGRFVLLRTVLRFENVDGIVVRGARLGELRNLVIEGNCDDYWLDTDVGGTEKGTHGIAVGGPTLLSSNPSSNFKQAGNPLGVGAASVSLGLFVGVFGFDQQGILSAQSSSVFASFSASSNNRRRGYYADGASTIWAKSLSACGNYIDGVISDNGSQIMASSASAACGNGGAGAFAQSVSMLDMGSCICKGNRTGGARSQNNSTLQAPDSLWGSGGITGRNGIQCQNGGAAIIDGATIEGFLAGLVVQTAGNVRCIGTLTVNNCTTGVSVQGSGSSADLGAFAGAGNGVDYTSLDLGSLIIGGTLVPPAWGTGSGFPNLKLINGANISVQAVSGIGDVSWSLNGTVVATMKAGSGTFFPNTTSATLGRTAERWANVFATKASFSVASLSAAGGGQAGAARLDNTYTDVTTVASGAGVRLNYAVGERQEVWNSGANPLSVYPPTGAQIGTAAANAPVTVAAGAHAAFVAISATQWRQMP